MKVRIAAVFATVLLAASIGGWLWIDRGSSKEIGVSSEGRNPSQGTSIDETLPRPPEKGHVDSSAALPRTPAPVLSAPSPQGNLPPAPAPRPNSLPTAPTIPPENSPIVTAPPAKPEPDQSEKAAIDVDKVGLMLRDYRTRMGENPFGTNAEIMKAVMGHNPKQARLGPPEGQSLNSNGELVDRWGTPYFFHQLSKSSMEIRSAGPDKVLWTEDDVIQH